MVFLGRKLSHFCQHPQTRPKVDVSIHQGAARKTVLRPNTNQACRRSSLIYLPRASRPRATKRFPLSNS
jgi:hypothetical protein